MTYSMSLLALHCAGSCQQTTQKEQGLLWLLAGAALVMTCSLACTPQPNLTHASAFQTTWTLLVMCRCQGSAQARAEESCRSCHCLPLILPFSSQPSTKGLAACNVQIPLHCTLAAWHNSCQPLNTPLPTAGSSTSAGRTCTGCLHHFSRH